MKNDILHRAIRFELGRLMNLIKLGELDHLGEKAKKDFMADSIRCAVDGLEK
jgi:hypothetical protein